MKGQEVGDDLEGPESMSRAGGRGQSLAFILNMMGNLWEVKDGE